jgi:hypothetical protein
MYCRTDLLEARVKHPASADIPARRPARRSGEDRHPAIITSLYEAATGALDWTEALRPMSWSFQGLSGVLFIEGGHGDVDLLAMPGWSARAQHLYATNFRHVDPYAAFARRSPQERCIHARRPASPSEAWRIAGCGFRFTPTTGGCGACSRLSPVARQAVAWSFDSRTAGGWQP